MIPSADLQEDIITSIGNGKDTLGLMPTGGGKSITFQVPALAKEGLCIVITPLIALMKDQVQNLKKRGIKAIAIYSGMTRQEIVVALENCIFGDYKFLYISPERLDTEIFRAKLRSMKISMITVDESHCISQWGYRLSSGLSENSGYQGSRTGCSGLGTDRHGHSRSSEGHTGAPPLPGRKRVPYELRTKESGIHRSPH